MTNVVELGPVSMSKFKYFFHFLNLNISFFVAISIYVQLEKPMVLLEQGVETLELWCFLKRMEGIAL